MIGKGYWFLTTTLFNSRTVLSFVGMLKEGLACLLKPWGSSKYSQFYEVIQLFAENL